MADKLLKSITLDGQPYLNSQVLPVWSKSASVPSGNTATLLRSDDAIVPRTGIYIVYGFAQFATNATGARQLSLAYSTDDFVTVRSIGTYRVNAAPTGNTGLQLVSVASLPANAKLTTRIIQTSGATLNVSTDMYLCEIG